MYIAELLKDKRYSIEVVYRKKTYHFTTGVGMFKKTQTEDRIWQGYALVKNGKKLLESFGHIHDYCVFDLFIDGEKQSADKETARAIFVEIEDLYEKQEQKKREAEQAKAKALLEQKKQVYYDILDKKIYGK